MEEKTMEVVYLLGAKEFPDRCAIAAKLLGTNAIVICWHEDESRTDRTTKIDRQAGRLKKIDNADSLLLLGEFKSFASISDETLLELRYAIAIGKKMVEGHKMFKELQGES
jgi:hypothetical protein